MRIVGTIVIGLGLIIVLSLGWGTFVGNIGLSKDATFFASFIGGMFIGYIIGRIAVVVAFD